MSELFNAREAHEVARTTQLQKTAGRMNDTLTRIRTAAKEGLFHYTFTVHLNVDERDVLVSMGYIVQETNTGTGVSWGVPTAGGRLMKGE